VRANMSFLNRFGRRFTRDQSGASALEFAMISPVLLFMIIGIIQLGFALNKGATVQWAIVSKWMSSTQLIAQGR
jgi:Flp pilus assembly protein TadG